MNLIMDLIYGALTIAIAVGALILIFSLCVFDGNRE